AVLVTTRSASPTTGGLVVNELFEGVGSGGGEATLTVLETGVRVSGARRTTMGNANEEPAGIGWRRELDGATGTRGRCGLEPSRRAGCGVEGGACGDGVGEHDGSRVAGPAVGEAEGVREQAAGLDGIGAGGLGDHEVGGGGDDDPGGGGVVIAVGVGR